MKDGHHRTPPIVITGMGHSIKRKEDPITDQGEAILLTM